MTSEEEEKLLRIYGEDQYHTLLLEMLGEAMGIGKSVEKVIDDVRTEWDEMI